MKRTRFALQWLAIIIINLLLLSLLTLVLFDHLNPPPNKTAPISLNSPSPAPEIKIHQNINQLVSSLALQQNELNAFLLLNQDALIKDWQSHQEKIDSVLESLNQSPLNKGQIQQLSSTLDGYKSTNNKIKKLKSNGTLLNSDIVDYVNANTVQFKLLLAELNELSQFKSQVEPTPTITPLIEQPNTDYSFLTIGLLAAILILFNLKLLIKSETPASSEPDANHQLELELKQANTKLNDVKNLLEMTDIMLATNNIEELFKIIEKYCSKILHFSSGHFYLLNDARDIMLQKASWGEPSAQAENFNPSDCWALRTGHNHDYSKDTNACLCEHIHTLDKPVAHSICIPLRAQIELLGLLYVEIPASQTIDNNLSLLISGLAEMMALAIANIQLRHKLYEQSLHDPLTNLYNRRFFMEFFLKSIRQHERQHKKMGLLLIDVDHFKKINDQYGHDIGDDVLKEIAVILQENCREADLVARLGGEEFTIILQDIQNDILLERAEIIRTACAEKVFLDKHDQTIRVTISIGAAIYPLHGTTPEKLLSAADAALYLAKHRNRNNTVLFNYKELIVPSVKDTTEA